MQLTKEGATFTQNNQNFYVGDIESNNTIMVKDDFIVIGNIKTQKNIVAAEGLIVMGDITSKAIYVYRDLLCTGKMDIQSIEVEGTLRELGTKPVYGSFNLENIVAKKSFKDDIRNIEFDEKEGVKTSGLEEIDVNAGKDKKESVDSINQEQSVAKNNVIKDREDVKLYDKVRHRVYGSGIITNLTTKGIYVEFHSGEVKRFDLNKALNQGTLKKDVDYTVDGLVNHIEEKEIRTLIDDVVENNNSMDDSDKNGELQSKTSTEVHEESREISKKKEVKRKSRECISPAKQRLKESNIVTTLEKIRVGSVILHETLGEGTIEEFNTRRIKVSFLDGGTSSLDAKLVLKLKVMKVKIY